MQLLYGFHARRASVYAADRSASIPRSQSAIWFQLAGIWDADRAMMNHNRREFPAI